MIQVDVNLNLQRDHDETITFYLLAKITKFFVVLKFD